MLAEQLLALAQEVAHPFSLGLVLCYAALLHQHRCEWQTAQAYVEALLTLVTEHGFQLRTAEATWLRGAALVGQGQFEAGIAQLCQWLTATQDREQSGPLPLALLAEAYGAVERLDPQLGHAALLQ